MQILLTLVCKDHEHKNDIMSKISMNDYSIVMGNELLTKIMLVTSFDKLVGILYSISQEVKYYNMLIENTYYLTIDLRNE